MSKNMVEFAEKTSRVSETSSKVLVPPLKIQGIKTKVVPAISGLVELSEDSLWVEPFMGSGVVGFNLAPKRAVFGDSNPYVIRFYDDVRKGKVTAEVVRRFLTEEGRILLEMGAERYYEVRKRFNETSDSLDFLFLNRSCFNGLMRFNRDGRFNVPFCRKPERFSKAYVTKIANQVAFVENLMKERDWTFLNASFNETLSSVAGEKDVFVYCDPPYSGRHSDYYDSWSDDDDVRLRDVLVESGFPFVVSTWKGNSYRTNPAVESVWGFCDEFDVEHFYHVGASEDNRSAMTEALLTNRRPDGTILRP